MKQDHLTACTREEFMALFHGSATLRATAFALGLTDEEMGRALLEAQHEKIQARRQVRLAEAFERVLASPEAPTDTGKTWCGQCERLVKHGELISCRSQFCKAKAEYQGKVAGEVR